MPLSGLTLEVGAAGSSVHENMLKNSVDEIFTVKLLPYTLDYANKQS